MSDLYVYRKPARRHSYRKFRLRRQLVIIFTFLLIAIAAAIFIDASRGDEPKPDTSAVQSITIGDNVDTIRTDFFQFSDKGKWALNKQESTATKYVYFKFRGVQPQHQLTIYINEEPISLYLAGSRVLPVRIVNNNSFDTANVYGPCGSTYKPGELHKIKTVTIEGAEMLCDPDTPQYSVVLSEISDDWRIELQRRNGTFAKYVITFRDLTLDPGPETIKRIADSFKSL